MSYDRESHHRRSIRLKGYDYAAGGCYFITICTQNRECLYGEIVGGEMRLNEAGRMIQTIFQEMPEHYPGIDIDEFVVMPDHFHGIVVNNVGAGPRACPQSVPITKQDGHGVTPPAICHPSRREGVGNAYPGGHGGTAPTLGDMVHRFKSLTTARYRHGVNNNNWPPFLGKLWQRNYYEHIIRNEADLSDIRQYIANNPLNWQLDLENPIPATTSINVQSFSC
jgi:putative transposase